MTLWLTWGRSYAQQYFPDGMFAQESTVQRYSLHLSALKERPLRELLAKTPQAQIYRFLWLRTFHNPICVRLTISPSGASVLTTKRTNGHGGYEPGRLVENRTIRVRPFTTAFQDEVARLGFWDLPAEETRSDVVTLDGAQWILEAVQRGRYHVVDRISPPLEHPVRILGEMLAIHLANFKLLYQEVY